MPASLNTIAKWIRDAMEADANFLIIAGPRHGGADDDPGDDYPVRVWAEIPDDVHQKTMGVMVGGEGVQEVYDLRADLHAQLSLPRCYLVPHGKAMEALEEPLTREMILAGVAPKKHASTAEEPPSITTRVRRADPRSAMSALENALETGVGSLSSRFARAVKDA